MAPKHFAPVWQHYERHEPTGRSKHHRAICKFCKYELSGQPERMKTHLQRCSGCPQHIKDDFGAEDAQAQQSTGGDGGASSAFGRNNFAISTSAMEFEQSEDTAEPSRPGVRMSGPPISATTPMKRRRSMEIGSGAEGLAGLPWAPMANASAIAPTQTAVPPAFSTPYASSAATTFPPPPPPPQAPASTASTTAPPPLHPPQSASAAVSATNSSGTSAHNAAGITGGSSNNGPHAPLTPAGAAQMGGSSMQAPYHVYQSEASPFSGVYENVRGYYSRYTPINKMQTSIGPTISPHPIIRDAISKVPKPVRDRFYGCGTPLPTGIDGLRVLDLGCGAGRDCYVAAKLVGPSGEVIGVDMTDEQLRVAREFVSEYSKVLGYQPHLRFVKGYIEFLNQLPDLYSGSIDVCISNNAVNLSPNKELVLRSVFDILKEGGEFQFSDIYADRRLPNHVRSHPVLMGECLGGALYTEDFKRLCQRVGFMDARQVSPPAAVRIESPELRDLLGATQFYSITFRLFKFSRPSSVLEPTREDYGQVAIYRGTIEGQRARTRFDNKWAFEANRPVLVDGNTAVMLGESWLRRHFEVRGDRSQHFGGFMADPPAVQYEPWETDPEYEEYVPGMSFGGLDASSITGQEEALVRRRGFLPFPTPYFLNGLQKQKQQQQQQQQSGAYGAGDVGAQGMSERSSPMNDSYTSPQTRTFHSRMNSSAGGSNHVAHQRTAALREHPTTFPRLSSFSISQSNVRSDGTTSGRPHPPSSIGTHHYPLAPNTTTPTAAQPPPYQKYKRTSSPRFVMPVHRVSSSYKSHHPYPQPISAGVSPTAGPVSGNGGAPMPIVSPLPPNNVPPQHTTSLASSTMSPQAAPPSSLNKASGTSASSPTPNPRSADSPSAPGYTTAPLVALSTSSSSTSLAQSATRFETRQTSFSSGAATASSRRSPIAAVMAVSPPRHHSPGPSIVTAASIN
ncbi:hypothetical protein IW140_003011 [Coemansia sp. RSA 1813]|nr:hypothetical protein LPJ74_001299 [Coemansia sp. RSA 1843]KAJ2213897.1 hypothetical protein EV179_003481 [Coemansia sp. RSA 487]KAJ2569603.1 hypothetical protein IW140_003011 [Coemansia sp. RSA 1813]